MNTLKHIQSMGTSKEDVIDKDALFLEEYAKRWEEHFTLPFNKDHVALILDGVNYTNEDFISADSSFKIDPLKYGSGKEIK